MGSLHRPGIDPIGKALDTDSKIISVNLYFIDLSKFTLNLFVPHFLPCPSLFSSAFVKLMRQ